MITSASEQVSGSCVADRLPRATDSAMSRSRSGSLPPTGDRPALMASTFQPDDADGRCTTTTRGGGEPSVPVAEARRAAIGMPTVPGPTTAILLGRMNLLCLPGIARRPATWLNCDHRATPYGAESSRPYALPLAITNAGNRGQTTVFRFDR